MIKSFYIILFSCIIAYASTISAKVEKVIDGDTIKVVDKDGGKFKIRLKDIDAPELNQLYGIESKAFLEFLTLGKEVTIFFKEIDLYGRIIGTITLENDSESVNRQIMKAGMAWWYSKYSDDKDFQLLEIEAKSKKLGIWQNIFAVPPWEFRKEKPVNQK